MTHISVQSLSSLFIYQSIFNHSSSSSKFYLFNYYSHFTLNSLANSVINSVMLRRNSLSFSWKLIIPPTNNPNNSALYLLRSSSSVITHARSASSVADTPPSSAADSRKLGFRAFGSAAAIDTTPSLAALSVSRAVDIVRHYGQCYWELSKARLRLIKCFNFLLVPN